MAHASALALPESAGSVAGRATVGLRGAGGGDEDEGQDGRSGQGGPARVRDVHAWEKRRAGCPPSAGLRLTMRPRARRLRHIVALVTACSGADLGIPEDPLVTTLTATPALPDAPARHADDGPPEPPRRFEADRAMRTVRHLAGTIGPRLATGPAFREAAAYVEDAPARGVRRAPAGVPGAGRRLVGRAGRRPGGRAT